MSKIFKSKYFIVLLMLVLAAGFKVAGLVSADWQSPPTAQPGGEPFNPIHTDDSSEWKFGPLGIGNLGYNPNYSGIQLNGVSSTIWFFNNGIVDNYINYAQSGWYLPGTVSAVSAKSDNGMQFGTIQVTDANGSNSFFDGYQWVPDGTTIVCSAYDTTAAIPQGGTRPAFSAQAVVSNGAVNVMICSGSTMCAKARTRQSSGWNAWNQTYLSNPYTIKATFGPKINYIGNALVLSEPDQLFVSMFNSTNSVGGCTTTFSGAGTGGTGSRTRN